MRQICIFLFPLLLLSIACNEDKKQPITTKLADTALTKSYPNDIDTVTIPEVPENSYDNVILPPGIYHSDEVDTQVRYDKWMGLYYKDGRYSIKQAGLTYTRVYDPIMDDDSTHVTGIRAAQRSARLSTALYEP